NLAALRILEEENGVQDEAVNAARKSVDLTTNQYKAGTVSYLNVITVQPRGRLTAPAVLLVQALGGGWTATELPSSADVTKREDPAPRAPGDGSGGRGGPRQAARGGTARGGARGR